jgi:hypothetical protein
MERPQRRWEAITDPQLLPEIRVERTPGRPQKITEDNPVGKRSSSSTQRKEKRKPSGKAFARGLGPHLAENIIESVNYERTQSARYKRHSSEVEEGEDSRIPKLLNVKRVNTGDESPLLASKSSFQKALR